MQPGTVAWGSDEREAKRVEEQGRARVQDDRSVNKAID